MNSDFLPALILALITFGTYLPVWHCGFVLFDDAEYVTDNRMVQAGLTWTGVKWAFTTFQASNWHPLTWLSHMLDVQLFGPGPRGPHLVNVLLHISSTVLLFLLLRRLTGARWRSAMVAALFALHPLHVESVAWIAERKDVLSGLFFMLTLWFWTRGWVGRAVPCAPSQSLEQSAGSGVPALPTTATGHLGNTPSTLDSRPSTLDYFLALLFFALGLMSKPMLVTLPFVLLLLDYWPLRRFTIGNSRFTRSWWHPSAIGYRLSAIAPLVREKLPFLALSIASCVVTFVAQNQGGAVRSLTSFSIGERLGNAAVGYAQYLAKTFWPADLAIFYPHPGQWPAAQVILSALLIAGLCLVVLWTCRMAPFAATGWFWFLGMLVPVIGVVQVSNQFMADRYVYLPAIGVFMVLAWGAVALADGCRMRRAAMIGAATLVVAGCALVTAAQLRHWYDAESLSRHALAVTSNNFVAHNTLGVALLDKHRADDAIEQFQLTLRLRPDFADAWCNLGMALLQKQDINAAIVYFRKAATVEPRHALAQYNLATALLELGEVREAIGSFQKAVELQPRDAVTHLNFGNALLRAGQLDRAVVQYRQALALEPDSADAWNNLGTALLQSGRLDEAVKQFERALSLQPDHANAHNNLAEAFARQGFLDKAVVQYEKTLAIQPGADAHNNLAIVLIQQERWDAALAHLRAALQLAPDLAAARHNLGYALLRTGHAPEAVRHLEQAANLQPDNARTLCALAWVLATCREDSVRNGTRAVGVAERANQLTGGQDPAVLRTLAAALAEAGNYAEATQAARKALDLAIAASDGALVADIRSEIRLYESARPVRE